MHKDQDLGKDVDLFFMLILVWCAEQPAFSLRIERCFSIQHTGLLI